MEYVIAPDSSSYFWRLMTTGSGKFDAWTFDVKTANLADSTIFPPLKKYKQPDPLEPFNRAIYSFNKGLDRLILKPTARAYETLIPKPKG